MIRTCRKILLFFICGLFLFNTFLPAFADEETVTKRETVSVNFLCEIDEDIETDEYSPVVVKILNEQTFETFEFKLYQYNNFSERYEIPPGIYSILYARIDNRNDIVFEVESADSFDIGLQKVIYFKLHDSLAMPYTTTTKYNAHSTTEKKTAEKTLYTLYDPSFTTERNTNSETNTDLEESTTRRHQETVTDKNGNIITETDTENKTTDNTDFLTFFQPEKTTVDIEKKENAKKTGTTFVIIAALICLLVVILIITLQYKKR